ncbi:MAG: DUF1036 domain-containing protein [Clostridiales Family XIII bacterium]|jgi:hypothetical protein|nr:DUF1036 domain-containing protein [Clostridiales Family XIII bacterium]
MKKIIKKTLLLFSFFVFFLSSVNLQAEVSVKMTNDTDSTIYVAIATDAVSVVTKGWYKIEPKKNFVYSDKNTPGNAVDGSMGFYAKGIKSNNIERTWECKDASIEGSVSLKLDEQFLFSTNESNPNSDFVGFCSFDNTRVEGDIGYGDINFGLNPTLSKENGEISKTIETERALDEVIRTSEETIGILDD